MRATTLDSMDGISAAKAGIHDREIRDEDTLLQKWIFDDLGDLRSVSSRIWRMRMAEYAADWIGHKAESCGGSRGAA
jgi:hypothetical protein